MIFQNATLLRGVVCVFLRDYENDDSVDVLPLVSLAELNQGVQNRKEHMAIYVDLPEEEILEQTIHPTLLKIGDVDSENQKIKSSVQQLKPAAVEKFSSKNLKPDDVLFSCGGTIGKTFLMTNDYYKEYKEGLYPASGWIRIRVKPDITFVRAEYLREIISSQTYLDHLQALTTGSSIRRLKIKELQALKIPIPHLPIQEAVIETVRNYKAHNLDVDAIKVLNEKLWAALTFDS